MKVFFFMGRNPQNVSGVSWKLWRIERRGRSVEVSWGPAVLRRRRVVPVGILGSRVRTFPTLAEARAFELGRIAEKFREGYERRPPASR